MVNIGFQYQFASLLGLLDILLALLYLVFSIAILVTRGRALNTLGLLFITQSILAPLILLSSGVIIFFNAWKADFTLQFALLLLHILVIYLSVKDFVLYRRG
jgi:hypothetical protein